MQKGLFRIDKKYMAKLPR